MAAQETLIYSQWFHRVVKRSQYAPGEWINDDEASYLTCPTCGAERRDIPHGKEATCPCGLHMRRLGNTLQVWR